MAEWFETDDGRLINLDRVQMVTPLEGGVGGVQVFGDRDERGFYVWKSDGAPRLRARLRQLAQPDGETPAVRYRYDER